MRMAWPGGGREKNRGGGIFYSIHHQQSQGKFSFFKPKKRVNSPVSFIRSLNLTKQITIYRSHISSTKKKQ